MNHNATIIAIVEDDESLTSALERRFRLLGFEVRNYSSAEIFLDSTTLPQPDCLILDVQLGGMTGLDLQRGLRQRGARVPIIFITGYDSPAARKEAEEAGCSAFFLKPVPTKLLLEAINKALHPGSS